jgi:DNA-binding beta-propeller fold protein YncE
VADDDGNWVDTGVVQGATGATGETGATGATGQTGATGATGVCDCSCPLAGSLITSLNFGSPITIDAATGNVTALSPLPPAENIAVNQDAQEIYIANIGGVVTFTNQYGSILGSVNPAAAVSGLAYDPVRQILFVATPDPGEVLAYDVTTRDLLYAINAIPGSGQLAVNPATGALYVVGNDNSLYYVPTGATTPQAETSLAASAGQPAVDPASGFVYVPLGNGDVNVYDAELQYENAFHVGDTASAAAYNPATGKIYVTTGDEGTLAVIDNLALEGIYPVGASADAVTVDPARNLLYVADYGDGLVQRVDGATNAVAGSYAVPNGMYFNANALGLLEAPCTGGATGATGATGETGATGATGSPGSTGATAPPVYAQPSGFANLN